MKEMKLFPRGLKRGIEISSDSIKYAEIKTGEGGPILFRTLCQNIPEGLVNPSFSKENITDREALSTCLMKAIPPDLKGGEIALSVPDQVAKIYPLEFEDFPVKKAEAENLIRWRLKKMLPITADTMKVDFSVTNKKAEVVGIVASISSLTVLREYEDILRDKGFKPKQVDISSLNSVSLFGRSLAQNSIFVNISRTTVGIASIINGTLSLFRSKEWEGNFDRVGKETLSTIAYLKSLTPETDVKDLYIFNQTGEKSLDTGLEGNFEGTIHLVNIKDYIDMNGIDVREEFTPAIGAAMRI